MSEDANLSSSRVLLGFSGDYTAGETPLPIPNRAVKPLCADGTWGATPWESRSPPGYNMKSADPPPGGSAGSCLRRGPARRAAR